MWRSAAFVRSTALGVDVADGPANWRPSDLLALGLIEEAFKDSFADSLGWSDEEFDQFWKDPGYEFTAEDARRFDGTWDAWEFMLRR